MTPSKHAESTNKTPNCLKQFFDEEPASWQDLENLVQQAFEEMGYESRRDHEITTVRGTVRVDVYAKKHSTPIPTIIICECKYWKKPVTQAVVYSARAIGSDIGAHFNLIISKAGFQSGAQETRTATNVHLLNFAEFQNTFFEEWRTGMFMQLVQQAEPLQQLLYNDWTTNDPALKRKLEGIDLFQKYAIFFGDLNYNAYFIFSGSFPIQIIDPRGDPRDLKPLTIRSHREYCDISKQGAVDARKFFGI